MKYDLKYHWIGKGAIIKYDLTTFLGDIYRIQKSGDFSEVDKLWKNFFKYIFSKQALKLVIMERIIKRCLEPGLDDFLSVYCDTDLDE